MSKFENNIVVVGAGSAGLIAAMVGATARAKVVLIEKDRMGGDCLNRGCIPSKALIASAKVARLLSRSESFGIRNQKADLDFESVMERVHRVISRVAPKDSKQRYEEMGVACIEGQAQLVDGHHVEVGGRVISAKSVILATGAESTIPPIHGLISAEPLISENLWDLEALPNRLVVIGGGPIGCELAQAFRRLGSEVSIIESQKTLLPLEDVSASTVIASVFDTEGIRVLTGCKAEYVNESIVGVVDEFGSEVKLPFDRILVAAGRKPIIDKTTRGLLHLDANGVVEVNRYMQTSLQSVYACGDLVGPYQFTHMAAYQGWHAAMNALTRPFWRESIDYSAVPWCTYTDPEIARVGLSEPEAKRQGLKFDATEYTLADLDRAQTDQEVEGFVKVLTKHGTDKIIGALIVGSNAGEMIAHFSNAMAWKVGLSKLMKSIYVYPTRAEAIRDVSGIWRRGRISPRLFKLAEVLNNLNR